ncbi:GNAT family N-acetyltransferase [Alteribacter aurantiacus]|uniref:GNAT family N-acetyltransferase n=1 Tax=Alteribacter aurantiacus TaxID=254410 RepID=UPI0004248FFA|nr:GNAT family N-acetyltransferase [Alteribacter aurantiacus]
MKRLTKRLILEACNEDSLNYKTAEDFSFRPHILTYTENAKSDSSLAGWGPWLMIDRETHTVIGDGGFKGKPDRSGSVEIGYAIVPSYQNNGFATETVAALIQWGFATGHVNEIKAECHSDNVPSIRVLEKVGMRRENEAEQMIYWTLKKDG